MSEYGYDKERFPNLTGDMFDCPICTNVAVNPKECTGCGDMFCAKCIDDWMRKNNSCPKRCNGSIQFMTSKALMKIYNDLDIKCSTCPKVVKLSDLNKHQTQCKIPRCWNHDLCSGIEHENKQFGALVCSEQCQILDSILKTGGNVKKMYDLLAKFTPKVVESPVKSRPVSSLQDSVVSSKDLAWDQKNCGLGLQFENAGKLVMLKEPAYVFRTAIGSVGVTSGQHYWEIIPDLRTENELKVGVTTTTNFDLNTAFCDHVFGFAYYGLGQLRHNSNASGPQYGKRMKKEGVLGIFLNMDKGQLSFSLNGQNLGVAFTHDGLKKGPIYPAVALLHCAGCTIKGQLPIPQIFK